MSELLRSLFGNQIGLDKDDNLLLKGRDIIVDYMGTRQSLTGATANAATVSPAAAAAGINAAYAALALIGGGVINLMAGTYNVGASPIVPTDGVVLRGAGMGVTVIQQTVTAVRAFNLTGGFGSHSYVAFQDFTVNGLWQTNQTLGGDNDRHFAVNGVARLLFSNVECTNCRQMSITANFCDEVIVQGCRVRYSARDAINLTASRHCIVQGNVVSHCGDDAIAIHQTTVTGNPPMEGHTIFGNLIEDAFGIKILGGAKCAINGNTLRRVKGYGIYTEPSGVEGQNDQISIDITGNNITDVINPTLMGYAANICVGIYIGNAAWNFKPPVQAGATPSYTLPENLYYLSNSTSTQNAGGQGYNITGNTIYGFTLPAAQYSSWGFGQAFTASGFVDPDLSSGFKYSAQGIRVDGAFLSANITGNTFVGLITGVTADATMNILDFLRMSNNIFSRYSQFALSLETTTQLYGRVFFEQNCCDADPYFEHANRITPKDGTWDTAQFQPCVFSINKYKGVTARGNTYRNMVRVLHQGNGTISSEGNTYYMQPDSAATVTTANAANKGIWTPDGLGHWADRLIVEDSNPTSATYGQELGRSLGQSSSLPSSGYHLAGQFVRNVAFVESGAGGSKYTVLGWTRLTTGIGNVLNTDWREMRCLTGN